MVNGNGLNEGWKYLKTQGPWAFWCGVLLFGFWTISIQPMQRERETYSEALKSNADRSTAAVEAMVPMTRSIQDGVREQGSVLRDIKTEVEGQAALRKEAMLSMNKFADKMQLFCEQVRHEHPCQDKKLDAILDEVKKE